MNPVNELDDWFMDWLVNYWRSRMAYSSYSLLYECFFAAEKCKAFSTAKSTKSSALIISARPVSKLPAWRETLVLQRLRDQQQSTKECMNQSSGSLIGWINFFATFI